MSMSLDEMKAETERKLQLLESKIKQGWADAAEIRESGDETRLWVAIMLERQCRRSQRLVDETRKSFDD